MMVYMLADVDKIELLSELFEFKKKSILEYEMYPILHKQYFYPSTWKLVE